MAPAAVHKSASAGAAQLELLSVTTWSHELPQYKTRCQRLRPLPLPQAPVWPASSTMPHTAPSYETLTAAVKAAAVVVVGAAVEVVPLVVVVAVVVEPVVVLPVVAVDCRVLLVGATDEEVVLLVAGGGATVVDASAVTFGVVVVVLPAVVSVAGSTLR